ncbi:uncharacterized protein TNCV_2197031 [Trichonephila clavipes]|nr:uncharacterized protein TNCV_2197031 [Trichonephila clavipes]
MRPSWSPYGSVIHLKRQLGVNQLARLCAHEPIADVAVDGLPRGVSCIKAPLQTIHGAADVDEADISTRVAVDQRSANCMEEAVRSFTSMRSRCRSSRTVVTFRNQLPDFRVVWCSSVHGFQTCITVEPFRCARATMTQ